MVIPLLVLLFLVYWDWPASRSPPSYTHIPLRKSYSIVSFYVPWHRMLEYPVLQMELGSRSFCGGLSCFAGVFWIVDTKVHSWCFQVATTVVSACLQPRLTMSHPTNGGLCLTWCALGGVLSAPSWAVIFMLAAAQMDDGSWTAWSDSMARLGNSCLGCLPVKWVS